MIKRRLLKKLIIGIFYCFISSIACLGEGTKQFQDGDTVCFLGDSITHSGGYGVFIYDYYATRFPDMKLTVNNCGIAGDSAYGAVKRLDWDVLEKSPNKVIIMLGMNDIGRNSYGEGKTGEASLKRHKRALDAHKNNMIKILDKLKEKNIDIILITPSPYDQEADVKTKNLKGANDALGICAVFCKEQAEKYNAGLVDFHATLTALNRKMQKKDPTASLIGKDRVHPHMMGHQVMAYQFLKDQRVTPVVATVDIDVTKKKVTEAKNCAVKNLKMTAATLSFDYLAKSLPYPVSKEYKEAKEIVPLTKDLNQEIIRIKGLKKGNYALLIDGKSVAKVNAGQLAKGLNIATLSTPQQKQALAIHRLIMKRRSYENKLRGISKLEIEMRGKKVDLNDENSRKKYLKDFTLKIQTSPYKKYYLRLIERYRNNKSKEADIKNNIQKLTKEVNKANKPVSHNIMITR